MEKGNKISVEKKTYEVVNLINLVLVIMLLFSAVAGASGVLGTSFEITGFDSWSLQQKQWVRTQDELLWPTIGWAEAKLGEENWIDYELSFKVEPHEYGQDGQIRLYFRTTFPFLCYSLNITEENISISRYDGNHERTRILDEADLGVKAGEIAEISLVVKGNKFQAYRNKQLILEAESAKYKNGSISFWAENTTFTVSDFHIQGTEDKDFVSAWQGYYPKGDPRSGGVKDLMLIYNNFGNVWNMSDALPYVTYLGPFTDMTLSVNDWFFDSFLFLALKGPEDHAFDSPARGTPATKKEWQWFLDILFEENRQLAAFERAYNVGKEHLGETEKLKIYIMIPNPMAQITDFGDVDGTGSLNFSFKDPTQATDNRFRAVKWYVDQAVERFEEANFENLELVGFYWVEEMIHYEIPGEVDLIRQVADYLHNQDLKFSWIPWFNAAGHGEWESLGFDLCIHQPNHMFSQSPASRFIDVARQAQRYGQGIEIEADGRILNDKEQREKFLNYLRAGVTLGYMDEAVHGYYQDVGLFAQAALSSVEEIREIYDLVYQFVKGEFDEPLGAKTKEPF